MKQNKEITRVYHDEEDGAWQFFSNDEFDDYRKVIMIVGLGEVLEKDATLLELASLPPGYFAERSAKGESWEIKEI